MGRAPCCDKAHVKRGPWSPEEDAALRNYIQAHGNGGNWIALPKKAGLMRCGKSCRLRWLNYLRPDIKHGGFTEEEENIICTLYNQIGSRWSVIASQLPGRTDNDVKNYWNTKLKKKLIMTGKLGGTLLTTAYNQTTPPLAPPTSLALSHHDLTVPSCQSQSSISTISAPNSSIDPYRALNFINAQSLSLDPIELYGPKFMDLLELGAANNSRNIDVIDTVSSQEVSSISDNSCTSHVAHNKSVLIADHDHEGLIDFGFRIPSHDLDNIEADDQAAPICYSALADFTCSDHIKPKGLMGHNELGVTFEDQEGELA